ncbi:MAG: hypothetical protein QM764_19955 [Chitinophagaceae bacterium]
MGYIKNLGDISNEQLNEEVRNGAKFVVFQYCISIFILTFKRGSDIYFIRANESTIKHSISFTLISLLFGWWGIPWGPVYTIGTVSTNISGGKNITPEVLQILNRR